MKKERNEIHVRVSVEERDMIRKRMESTGIKNLNAFMKKMAIDGYIIMLDLSDIKEVVRLIRINSNNLNQYVKRANENGSIYLQDIRQLQEQQEEIWESIKQVLERLSNIK
nr:plasmid mobilization relaxosome protein MobC [uncultured Butyrivibrio sp.]